LPSFFGVSRSPSYRSYLAALASFFATPRYDKECDIFPDLPEKQTTALFPQLSFFVHNLGSLPSGYSSMRVAPSTVLVALALAAASPALAAAPVQHNVIIFVADGLRYASVTPDIAPTLSRVKSQGVDFTNSHAMYPTLTTANASAIATGHYLGDTGDYANVLYTGFPLAALQGSSVPFLENDAVLREVKTHFADGYMGPLPLLCAAHAAGLSTAVIGKLGPAAIQAIDCLGDTILIDDVTNKPKNDDGSPSGDVAIDPEILKQIVQATGADQPPKTSVPNVAQQQYLLAAATKVVLPALKARGKPFALLYWSRDPDASQHAQQDSLGAVVAGINGPTAHAAITNADSNLKGILDALDALGLAKSTDVFVTADHGFSTIAKSVPGADGGLPPPSYPQGFVALDVASWLNQKVFDPDAGNSALDPASGDHPSRGNGIIGASADAPMAVVAANGGSDFIYTPGPDGRAQAKAIFDHLLDAPYVGALFVNDDLLKGGGSKDFAGALPMSAVRLIGAANVPEPSIVVGFRSFDAKGCTLGAELCAVEIADTSLQTGQGMHGSPSRADTRNFMAAIGPDFKKGYVDRMPVSNADIAPTLAHVLGFDLSADHPAAGALVGRAIGEAFVGGKRATVSRKVLTSLPAPNGVKTVLDEQIVGSAAYFDAAGIPGRVVGLTGK
jgi:arylsulfatase A-like enzyme